RARVLSVSAAALHQRDHQRQSAGRQHDDAHPEEQAVEARRGEGSLNRGHRGQREETPRGARELEAGPDPSRNSLETGVSRHVPHVSRSASHISPIVTYARDAWISNGIRFSPRSAPCLRRASAPSTSAESRRSRSALTLAICFSSSAGSIRRISSSLS